MFKNYSSEQVARIVSFVVLVLGFFGYKGEASVSDIVGHIDSLVVALSFFTALAMDIYGYIRRVAKGDVNIFGARIQS